MTPSQLTRTMNWVAMSVALLLLVMVGYHIYQRHYTQQRVSQMYQFNDLPALNSIQVSADIQKIIDGHIFGVIPEAPQPSAVVVKEPTKPAPKTRLNIKLTGIIDSDSPKNGIAMIEVERGRTLVVAVGEKIGKTDAILHQVLPGEILLDRNGSIESVKMARKTLSLTKLDTSLLDSLPQAYDAERDSSTYETQGSTSSPPKGPSSKRLPTPRAFLNLPN
jgi:type II secretory pathway component PulC